jgi:hypothetical protein
MSSYPTLTDIEMRWRTAVSGVCVIVEGQTEQDDAWFYSRWFGDRAREVTFFPQDGWERVVDAVAELRVKLGARAVYGIIDRDFETAVGANPFPGSGVLRTPKYTLENYLLEAGCWFRCVQPYTLRSAKPGWLTPEDAQGTIFGLHQQCLPLSAFNWTLKQARSANQAAFAALPEEQHTYRTHPNALANLGDVPGHLRSLGGHLGLTGDLGQVYQERLAHLQGLPQARLEEVVSGKYVHKLLSEQFPLRLSGKRSWDDMLSAYLFHCPAPPPDLMNLITSILADARS